MPGGSASSRFPGRVYTVRYGHAAPAHLRGRRLAISELLRHAWPDAAVFLLHIPQQLARVVMPVGLQQRVEICIPRNSIWQSAHPGLCLAWALSQHANTLLPHVRAGARVAA